MNFIDEGVQERIYHAVAGPDGATLTGYEDLRLPDGIDPPIGVPLTVDAHFREYDIRLAILAKRLYAPELTGGDTVTILFAVALSWTFRPLLALRESIRQRGAEDLDPVPTV